MSRSKEKVAEEFLDSANPPYPFTLESAVGPSFLGIFFSLSQHVKGPSLVRPQRNQDQAIILSNPKKIAVAHGCFYIDGINKEPEKESVSMPN